MFYKYKRDTGHRVLDKHSTYHPDADPDSDFYLMRIRIRLCHPDAYPDPEQDPSYQIKAQILEKLLK